VFFLVRLGIVAVPAIDDGWACGGGMLKLSMITFTPPLTSVNPAFLRSLMSSRIFRGMTDRKLIEDFRDRSECGEAVSSAGTPDDEDGGRRLPPRRPESRGI